MSRAQDTCYTALYVAGIGVGGLFGKKFVWNSQYSAECKCGNRSSENLEKLCTTCKVQSGSKSPSTYGIHPIQDAAI